MKRRWRPKPLHPGANQLPYPCTEPGCTSERSAVLRSRDGSKAICTVCIDKNLTRLLERLDARERNRRYRMKKRREGR